MPKIQILNQPNGIGADDARRRLEIQRYSLLSPARLLRAASADVLGGFERVLVPSWLITLDVTMSNQTGRAAADSKPWRLVVDRLSGECRVVPDGTTVEETDVVGELHQESGWVPEDEAKRLAAQAMRWQILRSGSIHLRGLELIASRAQPVYCPVWLGYYTSAKGGVRVRCLNGNDGTAESAVYAIKVLRHLKDQADVTEPQT